MSLEDSQPSAPVSNESMKYVIERTRKDLRWRTRPLRTLGRDPVRFYLFGFAIIGTAFIDLLLPVRIAGLVWVMLGIESFLDSEFDLLLTGISEPFRVVTGPPGRVLAIAITLIGGFLVVAPETLLSRPVI